MSYLIFFSKTLISNHVADRCHNLYKKVNLSEKADLADVEVFSLVRAFLGLKVSKAKGQN